MIKELLFRALVWVGICGVAHTLWGVLPLLWDAILGVLPSMLWYLGTGDLL